MRCSPSVLLACAVIASPIGIQAQVCALTAPSGRSIDAAPSMATADSAMDRFVAAADVEDLQRALDDLNGTGHLAGAGPSRPDDRIANTWLRLFSLIESAMKKMDAVGMPSMNVTAWPGESDSAYRADQLVNDRVQIPGGTTIVGFGPGAVYLTSRVGTAYQVVRVKVR
jgi:hypothetical protein